MKGLVYKNWMTILGQSRYLLLCSLGVLVIGALQPDGAYWSVYGVMMLSAIAFSTLQVDEITKWSQYCEILPVTRKTVVTAYYIVSCGMITAAILLYGILHLAAMLVRSDINPGLTLSVMTAMALLSFVTIGITFPLTLKFGSQKAPVIRLIVMGVIFGSLYSIMNSQNGLPALLQRNSPVLVAGIGICCILFLPGSWFVSVKIYEHKDLS